MDFSPAASWAASSPWQLPPTGSKAPVDMYKKDWDPAQHPLEAEGEALDPQQEGGKV